MFCPKCGTQLPDDAGFCLKCGARIGLVSGQQQAPAASSTQQVIAPSGATTLKCPSCGAPISPSFGEMLVTCAYCGSSVSLGNDGWKSINKHTMLTLKLSQQDDVLKALHGMMDTGLLHRHLQESSTLEEANLAMVPYWLIPVSARTSLVAVDMAMEAGQIATTAALAGIMGGAMSGGRGFGGGGGGLVGGVLLGTMMSGGGFAGGQGNRRAYQMDNDYNFPIVALKALTEYQPKDYQFSLDGRVIFDETKVKGMKVLNGDVGEDIAKSQAKTLVDQLQSNKAHAAHHMVQQISTESDVGEAELLHAPVWFVRYDHKNGKIVLVVDGNSGGLINSIGL
ncbi:MAG TPA: zinc ribbon domain-containing protein [Nitrososphaerales archaeon]